MLFNSVYFLCRGSTCTHGDIDLISLLIRSGVIGFNFHHLRDNSKILERLAPSEDSWTAWVAVLGGDQ